MDYLDKLLKVAAMDYYLDKLLKVAARILERTTGKRHRVWVGWVAGLVSSPKDKSILCFLNKASNSWLMAITVQH
jgi:hypothetical protein